jgi:uncharacterized protein with PIN domain
VIQVANSAWGESTPTSASVEATEGWENRWMIRGTSRCSGCNEPISSISWNSVVHSEAWGNTSMKLRTSARVSSSFWVGSGSHCATRPRLQAVGGR